MKSIEKCPSFQLISQATNGNENAVNKLLSFYDSYMSKASLRPFYDDYGNIYIAVDMELKGRIRTAIMEMLFKFELEIK